MVFVARNILFGVLYPVVHLSRLVGDVNVAVYVAVTGISD